MAAILVSHRIGGCNYAFNVIVLQDQGSVRFLSPHGPVFVVVGQSLCGESGVLMTVHTPRTNNIYVKICEAQGPDVRYVLRGTLDYAVHDNNTEAAPTVWSEELANALIMSVSCEAHLHSVNIVNRSHNM